MAQTSVYKVSFSVGNSGPYSTFIGIAGGTRGDIHTHSLATSIATAITSNLAGILTAMGAGTAAPGGTVQIHTYSHASAPDLWT